MGDVEARVAIKYLPTCKAINMNRGNTEHTYQIFMEHLSDLQGVYESLIDEESKKTFRGYWLGGITNRFNYLIHSNDAHYLTSGFIPEKGAIVIDGGVFDGGSAATFTQMGYQVYGFEMDSKNFNMAKKVAEEKGFVIENLGLGSYKHKMNYVSNISGSALTPYGKETTQITTIDSYVRENNIPRVDFIKLDVEGAELDTLKGAKISIARWKPILALSAYHRLEDFWTLVNFVKSIRSDYEFAMRQYPITPEDEPDYFRRLSNTFGNDFENILNSFGLDPYGKQYNECCILAR